MIWMFSPTRGIAKMLRKKGLIFDFCSVVRWNVFFYAIELGFAIALAYSAAGRTVLTLMVLLLFWRITELLFAFYGEVFSKGIQPDEAGLPINPSERIVLLTMAYVEIILAFGLIYQTLTLASGGAVLKSADGLFDAVFFSATTLTTTGSGDIAPVSRWSKAFAVYEAVTGIVFIAIALSAYVGDRDEQKNRRRQSLSGCFTWKRLTAKGSEEVAATLAPRSSATPH